MAHAPIGASGYNSDVQQTALCESIEMHSATLGCICTPQSCPMFVRVLPQFDSLGLRLKSSGVQVLTGVTGRFEHSQMHAVLGPSGSGEW